MLKAIIIGGSAGSFKLTGRIIQSLPEDFPLPVIICMHRLRNIRSGISGALSMNSKIRIAEPFDKEEIKTGKVYIAPANYHLLTNPSGYFSLSTYKAVNHSRPSIDLLMKSAAAAYADSLLGILVSGANSDGAEGMYAIHQSGGTCIVQDPSEAEIATMPEAALSLFNPDHVLKADKIINFMLNLTKQ